MMTRLLLAAVAALALLPASAKAQQAPAPHQDQRAHPQQSVPLPRPRPHAVSPVERDFGPYAPRPHCGDPRLDRSAYWWKHCRHAGGDRR